MRFKLTLRNVLLLAAVISIVGGTGIFAVGYPYRGEGASDLAWAMLAMAVIGALAAFMHRFRLVSLLTVTLSGYIVGLTSALQLLMTPNVAGGYAIAVLTVVTFAGHGLVIGMFAEFVVRMHRLTHGLLDRVIKDVIPPFPKPKRDEEIRPSENRE